MGVDEEESGSWALFKTLAFGDSSETCSCPFWLWRFFRWAFLGISGSGEEEEQEGGGGVPLVSLGVRVRHEKDNPGFLATNGHQGPAWCDLVRSSADAVLDMSLGGNT